MRLFMLALALTAVHAPAFAQEAENDPFERYNRAVYRFNDVVDRVALEPVARGYRAVLPGPVREGVSNLLENLREPVYAANNLLQGKPVRAGASLARFGLNTTVGVAGVMDVASVAGLKRKEEDFGQTLGVWGVQEGPYLVLPLLGPSNVRDAFGLVGDAALNPINYADFKREDEFRAIRTTLTVVNARANAIEAIDGVRSTSIDPYVTLRSTYFLLRRSALSDGVLDPQALPEFGIEGEVYAPPDSSETPAEDAAPEPLEDLD